MSDRMVRINELISQQLGKVISTEIELPQGSIVTITRVQTSPDLRHAKVYLSVLPESNQREVMSLLINSVKGLQHSLAQNITLRNIPKFRFFIDDTEQEAIELERLLDNLE